MDDISKKIEDHNLPSMEWELHQQFQSDNGQDPLDGMKIWKGVPDSFGLGIEEFAKGMEEEFQQLKEDRKSLDELIGSDNPSSEKVRLTTEAVEAKAEIIRKKYIEKILSSAKKTEKKDLNKETDTGLEI